MLPRQAGLLSPYFCAGAMENKSLNIFNSRLVLATPDTATDGDFARIEGKHCALALTVEAACTNTLTVKKARLKLALANIAFCGGSWFSKSRGAAFLLAPPPLPLRRGWPRVLPQLYRQPRDLP